MVGPGGGTPALWFWCRGDSIAGLSVVKYAHASRRTAAGLIPASASAPPAPAAASDPALLTAQVRLGRAGFSCSTRSGYREHFVADLVARAAREPATRDLPGQTIAALAELGWAQVVRNMGGPTEFFELVVNRDGREWVLPVYGYSDADGARRSKERAPQLSVSDYDVVVGPLRIGVPADAEAALGLRRTLATD